MTDPKVNIPALRALEAKATPGPWMVSPSGFDTLTDESIPAALCVQDDDDGNLVVLEADENMWLAAAARNALPVLLELAEAAREYIDTMHAELWKSQRAVKRLRVAFDALDFTPPAAEGSE